MSYEELSEFLDVLEDAGELVRVTVDVDPVLEIAEIVDRLSRQHGTTGGPAILFERVRGSAMPAVVNLLGNERRLSIALRAESLDAAAARIAQLLRPELPETWLGSLKLIPQLAQLTRLPPKIVKSGISQQVVKLGRDVNVRELPLLQNRPLELGPGMSAAQVFTVNPETSVRDISLENFSVRGQNSLNLHADPQNDCWQNYLAHRQARRQMPIAIVFGNDPVCTIAASAPLPHDTDECLISGFLRGKALELVKARTIPLDVPATAELVIEGWIDVEEPFQESGAIALSTGFYSGADMTPVMKVSAITHRSNPIFPAMIYGVPPTEKSFIDLAIERLLLPVVQTFLPEIIDLHLPISGASRNVLFVRIRKQYPQQARKVMSALWGMNGFSTAKMIIVVDDDIDIRNESRVWFQMAANTHPGRDTFLHDGPTDDADHAAPTRGIGRKLGIDATRKWPAEGHPREWPDELLMTQQVDDLVTQRWAEYGFGDRSF